MIIDDENPNEIYLPEIGTKSHDFVLKTEKGDSWRLSDYLGQVVALLFYPKNETLVCTKQLCSVRDHWTDYLATKAVVVGISPGTVEEHLQFGRRHKLPLSLLADTDGQITKKYSFHWLFPVSFTRVIVVVDAKGFIRTRKIMLRAFRPTDRNVVASIYEARADAIYENYDSLLRKHRKKYQ